MLIIRRQVGQAIRIQPKFDVDPLLTVRELFADGPLELIVLFAPKNVAHLGVLGDKYLLVAEDELFVQPEEIASNMR